MTEKIVNIISAEQNDSFQDPTVAVHKLDVDNIILTVNKKPSGLDKKGVWINIKYKYSQNGKDKIDQLRIQTPQLFSYGISQYEDTSPKKMSFVLRNNRLHEALEKGEDLSEDDLTDIRVENGTIQIFNDILKTIKEKLMKRELIDEIGFNKKTQKWVDVDWRHNVDKMELVKTSIPKNENQSQNTCLYARVVEAENFMKTKFYLLEENGTTLPLEQQETIEKLMTVGINCRVAAASLVVDSIFIQQSQQQPFLQVKVKEVVIEKFIEHNNKCTVALPKRTRNTLFEENSGSESE